MKIKEYNVNDVKLYDKNTGEEVLTLDSATLSMSTMSSISIPKFHRIDFSKVNTFEDMKLILQTFNIGVYSDDPSFEKIKPFIVEE